MTIGRTHDPENPFGSLALEAVGLFETGSRIPSGPAAMLPRQTGRTHDRNRTARQISHLFSCIQGAVHTWPEDQLARAAYLVWRAAVWRHAMLGSSPSMT